LDCIKLKASAHERKKITRMKRQSSEWDKISASYSMDEGLVSRMHKKLKILNTKRTNYAINKMN
jgi:hypothetical protein